MEAGDDKNEAAGRLSIRDQATISFVGNLVDTSVSFAGLVMFAYVLGAGGLGKFYFILAVVEVLLFPIKGVGQSVMKRGSERGLDPATFLGGGLVLGAMYVIGIVALGGILLIVAGDLIPYGVRTVLAGLAVFVSRIVFLFINDAYRGHGKTGFATLADNVLGIVETAMQVGLLIVGLGVTGLLVGTAVATILASLGHLSVTVVTIARPNWETFRSMGEFARWSVITSGIGTIYDRLPVLVLGIVVSEVSVGYYTSAMRLLMLGSYVGGSLAPALMVRTSSVTSAKADRSAFTDLEATAQYAAILAIALLFGSLAMPAALMRTFFGPTFAAAAPALVGLSVYHVINTYDTVTYSFFDGINEPEYATKATAAALVLRVGGLAAFSEEFELLGVVLVVVASHGIHLAIAELFLAAEFGQYLLPRGIIYQFASGAAMFAVVELVLVFVPIASWLHLLAVVGVGGICYVGMLVVVDVRFRHIVRDLLAEVNVSYA